MTSLIYPNRRIGTRILVLLLLCIICFPTSALAQKAIPVTPLKHPPLVQLEPVDKPSAEVRIIGADEQFSLAAYFLSRQDYGRAITEFERFCYYFPNDERLYLARFNIGMAHFHMNAYSLALQSFSTITDTSPPTPLLYKAAFFISECLLRQGDTNRAVKHLLNLAATANTPEVADQANYRLGWLYMENNRTDKAALYFARIIQPNQGKFDASGIEQALKEIDQLHLKSPGLAGLLSVVPGAGYVYTERYQDALISFLVNGLLFWAVYEAFDNDLPALGCLTGLAGVGFYTGSIYGSVSSAHKYNHNAYDAVLNRYKPSFTIGLGVDPNRQRYLVEARIRF